MIREISNLYESGSFDKANQLIEEGLKEGDFNLLELNEIGNIVYKNKVFTLAEEVFEQSYKLQPNFDAHFYLLKVAIELNKEDEVVDLSNEFYEKYEEELMEDEFHVLGKIFYKNNDFEATKILMYNAILFEQKDEFYYLRGLSRYFTGDQIGAIEDITSAMTLSPKRLKYYLKRIELKREMGLEKSADLDQEEFDRAFN